MKHSKLTALIFIALILGVVVGHFAPDFAVKMKPFAVIFLRMVKMIIAPLLFATLVTGIAGHGDTKQLGKIGIKNANGKLTKASKDIAETIKKKGVSSESRKQIYNIISDLFKDLADGIDASVIKNLPGLQSDDKEVQKKVTKSFVLIALCLVASLLTQMVLMSMLGIIGRYLMITVGAPIAKESCKAIAVKGNFEIEYSIVFNAFEFTEYVLGGAPVNGRLACVGIHTLNTINKVFSTKAFRKKFGISDDKDSEDKCTLAAFIIGNIIHMSLNMAAVFSPAFNAILS